MQSESAVLSITSRRRLSASMYDSVAKRRASGVLARVGVVDAVDAVLGHQQHLGVDLDRAQRGGGVGGHVGVAGAGGEDDDAPLLEVADRAAPDVRLGDLLDGDRRLRADVAADLLDGVLEREALMTVASMPA